MATKMALPVLSHLALLSEPGGQHGEVFTRRWVVDLMLDMAGYAADKDLSRVRFVEPASGAGAFVLPALERLAASVRQHGGRLEDAIGSFRSFEIQAKNLPVLRQHMERVLQRGRFSARTIDRFLGDAVVHRDYLLTNHEPGSADVVIGNPPYVRLEDLGETRHRAYKAVAPAMGGRADIFIGFFDVGLEALAPDGVCVFICADRWLRNSYGERLRKKVLDGYAVDTVLTIHDADAFESEVSAYPAITVIRRGAHGRVCLADGDAQFSETQASRLLAWMSNGQKPLVESGVTADWLPTWFTTAESWPDASPGRIRWLEQLEASFPLIEDTGVKVGIGVATGNDSVYVLKGDAIPDIEPERLLPLIVADDIRTGNFSPTGTILVNPWEAGGLVALGDWPRFAEYMRTNEAELRKRHTAKGTDDRWHKTIDRVNFDIIHKPKLLMQDMKAKTEPVFHPGGLYPHHNLYYLVSDAWDLETLGGLMLSAGVEAQVAAYCVKMRGKTLRFQAQYLRRVRVPAFDMIEPKVRETLADAFRARDRAAASAAALEAYGTPEIPA